MPGNIREAEYGPGGAIILGVMTIAVMIILGGLVIIPLIGSGQGNACIPEASGRPLLACESSAKAIVTIHSTHSLLGVHYSLYTNDELQADGNLAAGSSIITTVTIIFPTNESGHYRTVIMATSDWNGLLRNSDQAILTVECNQTYPVTLDI